MLKSVILISILTLLSTSVVGITIGIAQVTCVPDNNGVCLLQPDIINGEAGDQESSLGNYLSLLFKTLIGLAGALSVLNIVIGGFEYILSEVPGVKTSGKERIRNSLIGLILALAAWLILYTINPDLVNLSLKLEPIKQTPDNNRHITSPQGGGATW